MYIYAYVKQKHCTTRNASPLTYSESATLGFKALGAPKLLKSWKTCGRRSWIPRSGEDWADDLVTGKRTADSVDVDEVIEVDVH